MKGMARTDLRRAMWLTTLAVFCAALLTATGCAPEEPRLSKPAKSVPEGTIDPEVWGRSYPKEYESWLATKDPVDPADQQVSKYKRGDEKGRQYDKLSEYPYLSVITSGFGFSVEYNEPRGHWWAIRDQNEIDPARLKSGGVCLSCKTPYYIPLRKELGDRLLSMPYEEALSRIPEKYRELGGPTCLDCHTEKDLTLRPTREAMTAALETIGKPKLNEREAQIAVCGQCHCTYVIPRDKEMKATGLFYPWEGGEWGDVSVEDIIDNIEADPANAEWTQKTTGFKLGFIRHPEFELYTRQSTHFVNGVTCPDCHMPFKVEDDTKFADHDVTSALNRDMQPCRPCHPQSSSELRDMVIRIQDRFVSAVLNSGYAVAADATLFKIVNSRVDTTTAENRAEYAEARKAYTEALYRVGYLTAENSVGFHNPTEANRIAATSLSYSQRSAEILRKMLARNGVVVPNEVQLDLLIYLENRGVRGLRFDPAVEFKDPSGVAEDLWQENLAALRSGRVTNSWPASGTAPPASAPSSPTTP